MIGIIANDGKWIECPPWAHISTAVRHGTEMDFVLCKIGIIDIVGNLNRKQRESIFDYCTKNGLNLNELASSDLEDQLKGSFWQ